MNTRKNNLRPMSGITNIKTINPYTLVYGHHNEKYISNLFEYFYDKEKSAQSIIRNFISHQHAGDLSTIIDQKFCRFRRNNYVNSIIMQRPKITSLYTKNKSGTMPSSNKIAKKICIKYKILYYILFELFIDLVSNNLTLDDKLKIQSYKKKYIEEYKSLTKKTNTYYLEIELYKELLQKFSIPKYNFSSNQYFLKNVQNKGKNLIDIYINTIKKLISNTINESEKGVQQYESKKIKNKNRKMTSRSVNGSESRSENGNVIENKSRSRSENGNVIENKSRSRSKNEYEITKLVKEINNINNYNTLTNLLEHYSDTDILNTPEVQSALNKLRQKFEQRANPESTGTDTDTEKKITIQKKIKDFNNLKKFSAFISSTKNNDSITIDSLFLDEIYKKAVELLKKYIDINPPKVNDVKKYLVNHNLTSYNFETITNSLKSYLSKAYTKSSVPINNSENELKKKYNQYLKNNNRTINTSKTNFPTYNDLLKDLNKIIKSKNKIDIQTKRIIKSIIEEIYPFEKALNKALNNYYNTPTKYNNVVNLIKTMPNKKLKEIKPLLDTNEFKRHYINHTLPKGNSLSDELQTKIGIILPKKIIQKNSSSVNHERHEPIWLGKLAEKYHKIYHKDYATIMSYKRQQKQKNLTKNFFNQYLKEHYNVGENGAYTEKTTTKNSSIGNNGSTIFGFFGNE